MSWAVLGLGTNLGARRAILEGAIALLGEHVLARSALYATPPLGPPQPDYLNAAVRVRWDAPIEELLVRARELEIAMGRVRRVRWGSRTLDVDVLHWSAGSHVSPTLVVPHPELQQRTFALAPLLDVAPELESLRPRLDAIGGAPARAIPSWSRITREGDALCGEWLHDPDELVAQHVALSSFGSAPQPLAARPFTAPADLLVEPALDEVVSEARGQDFAPRACVVLGRDALETKGVLLGVPGLREAPPAASPRLQLRADGARRFVAAVTASSWL